MFGRYYNIYKYKRGLDASQDLKESENDATKEKETHKKKYSSFRDRIFLADSLILEISILEKIADSPIVNKCVDQERSENENLKLGQDLLLLPVNFHLLRLLPTMHKHKAINQLTYSK